ncbi:MAG: VOC family protein [Alphaproteobacteria bacterium]|nr:VOC family protein [Alphaproteobacteria bacterium]
MLNHVTLSTVDVDRAARFYGRVLGAIGVSQLHSRNSLDGALTQVGYGSDGSSYFWITGGASRSSLVHVAFSASSKEQVDAFFQAALDAGGADNGAPGFRPRYHPNYYAAFIFDPDGNNIEAVWFERNG